MTDYDILHYLSDADFEDLLSKFEIGAEWIGPNEIEVTMEERVASIGSEEGREFTTTDSKDYEDFMDFISYNDKKIFAKRAELNKTRLNGSIPNTSAVEAA